MQVTGVSVGSLIFCNILSMFLLYLLSEIEYRSLSPLLHPIAMNSPSGSYLVVKPGEGR